MTELDRITALSHVAAEFDLGVSLIAYNSKWKMTVFGEQGPIATATMEDVDDLCQAATIWVREVYAAELARIV